jgi:hypothetical protein
MNEQERREAQKRLEDEERRRRLSEGGESMRAQLAMEESERGVQTKEGRGEYLTPEEQQRREMMSGSKDVKREMGETRRAEEAMWGRSAEESSRPMSEEEMRRRGQLVYRAPSGAYYEGTEERSYIRETERREPSREVPISREREVIREERPIAPSQVTKPRQTEGYYQRPYPEGGPYGKPAVLPETRKASGKYTPESVEAGRMGAYPTQEPTTTQRVGRRVTTATGPSMSRARGTGGEIAERTRGYGDQAVSRTRDMTSRFTENVRNATQGYQVEEGAHRAGESLGRAIRRTVNVAREMSSGLRRGYETEGVNRPQRVEGREVAQREAYTREVPARETEVVREAPVEERRAPVTEERVVQEVRKREKEI